jgi:putative transposase
LSKDRTRLWLLEAIEAARVKHRFDLWAWVIMPEHVHLLIRPREFIYSSAAILASIKKPVGTNAVKYLEEHSPEFLKRVTVANQNRIYRRFWEVGGGYDKNLFEPAAIHEVIVYIHGNPVKRGLVARPEDWPWSSAADWSGAKDVLLRVDRTVPTLVGL